MNARMLFRGTGTALVTPFTPDDKVDEKALRRLIDIQIGAGIDALIVLGTTGENPNVSDDERRHIVDVAVEQAAGRVPVVIGTGSVFGRHTVGFESDVDELTFEHRAKSREGFALGAVRAAEWMIDQHGFFSLDDALDQWVNRT